MTYQQALAAAGEYAKTTREDVVVFFKKPPTEFGFCGRNVVGIMTTTENISAWVKPSGEIITIDIAHGGSN